MKFKINDRDWEIVEASQTKMCEVENVPEDPTNKFFSLYSFYNNCATLFGSIE